MPTSRQRKAADGPDELRAFLVELATDPASLGRYVRDPDGTLAEANLSEEDRAIVRSGHAGAIHARLAGQSAAATALLVVDIKPGDGDEEQPHLRAPVGVPYAPPLVLSDWPVYPPPPPVLPVMGGRPVFPPPPPPVIESWPVLPPPPPPVLPVIGGWPVFPPPPPPLVIQQWPVHPPPLVIQRWPVHPPPLVMQRWPVYPPPPPLWNVQEPGGPIAAWGAGQ